MRTEAVLSKRYFAFFRALVLIFIILPLVLPACKKPEVKYQPTPQATRQRTPVATPQTDDKDPLSRPLISQNRPQTTPAESRPATPRAGPTRGGTQPWQSEKPIKEPIRATISANQTVVVGNLATQQVKLSMPPGMLSPGAAVTVSNPDNPPPMAASKGTPLGAPVTISAGDRPTRLNEFMTITLKLPPGKVSSSDEGNLAATFYNENTREWELITPDKVDLQAGTIEFTTDHLSAYGAVREALEAKIKKKAESEAAAEVLSEQVFDKVADRVVDHFLKEKLKLLDYSTKSRVLSSVLKDKEYAKIAVKFSSGDSDGAMKDLTMFTGKKIAQVVETKLLNDALIDVAKARRFGPEAYEGIRNKIMEGAGETMATRSLKELTGAGTLGEWGIDVDVASEAAGYLAEGNMREAARIIGEKVADSFVIAKVGKVAVELTRQQMNSIKKDKLEEAYKAWKDGNPGHGYSGDKGNFATTWAEMKGGLQRQVMIDARAAENEIRRAGGQPPLVVGSREDVAFQARVAKELEAKWKAKAEKEDREKQIQDDINKLLSTDGMRRMMDLSSYFASGMTEEQKVDSILKARDRILLDTAGETLKDKDGNVVRLTNNDIVDLIEAQRGAASAPEGWKAYYALLKAKFGIDPNASPITLALVPATLNGEPLKEYTFTAKLSAPVEKARYDWYLKDKQIQSGASSTVKIKFPDEGSYDISVKLFDSAGREQIKAVARAIIKQVMNQVVLTGSSTTPITGNLGEVTVNWKLTGISAKELKGSDTYNKHIDIEGGARYTLTINSSVNLKMRSWQEDSKRSYSITGAPILKPRFDWFTKDEGTLNVQSSGTSATIDFTVPKPKPGAGYANGIYIELGYEIPALYTFRDPKYPEFNEDKKFTIEFDALPRLNIGTS